MIRNKTQFFFFFIPFYERWLCHGKIPFQYNPIEQIDLSIIKLLYKTCGLVAQSHRLTGDHSDWHGVSSSHWTRMEMAKSATWSTSTSSGNAAMAGSAPTSSRTWTATAMATWASGKSSLCTMWLKPGAFGAKGVKHA